MFRIVIAAVGLAVMAAAPLPALAQASQPGASPGAVAIPNRATVRSGTHGTRETHRNTLNRQKARATAEQQRHRRAVQTR
jgi:hypothetical protein